MKLIRFGAAGEEKPGVEQDGKRYDVSHLVKDYDESFFSNGGLQQLQEIFSAEEAKEIGQNERLGPPVHRPGKIVCIGLNYQKHAEESGMPIPTEPVIFFKASSSVTGPYDPVIIPRGSKKTDWEVELGVVISKRAKYVEEKHAMDYVGGYLLHNDVSEREFQLEKGGQWVKGKSCDTFAPIGPYLVTADEIADPHKLRLWLKVNDQMMQDGSTSDFIFNIPQVVSYLSQFMSLMPGDIISTGTPKGVGLGLNPPRYLKAGDIMELGIEGLGTARQEVKDYES